MMAGRLEGGLDRVPEVGKERVDVVGVCSLHPNLPLVGQIETEQRLEVVLGVGGRVVGVDELLVTGRDGGLGLDHVDRRRGPDLDPLARLLEEALGKLERLLGDCNRPPGGDQLPVGELDIGHESDDLDLETDRSLVAEILRDDDLGAGSVGAESVEEGLGQGQVEACVPAWIEEVELRVGLAAIGHPRCPDLGAAG